MIKKLLFGLVLLALPLKAAEGVKISAYPRATTLGDNDLFITAYYNGSSYTTNKGFSFTNFVAQLIDILPTSGSGGNVYINGSIITNANFATSANVIVNSSTTNVTFVVSALTDANVSASAGIDRGKLAVGTANETVINNGSGALSSTSTLLMTGTNASFKGTVTVDNLVATNGIQVGIGGTNFPVTGIITAHAAVITNGITATDVTASSLLRTDSAKKISPVTVGSGLTFDGTTLSASATNFNQQKVWIRTGVTNNGVFDNLTVWPGTGVTISTTNGTGNTNIDLVINSSATGNNSTTNQAWYDIRSFGGVEGAADNTAALTNAIWSIWGGAHTNEIVNATLFIPKGVWKITGGPLNFEASEQAVIGIPHKTSITTAGLATWSQVRIIGENPITYTPGTAQSGVTPTNGTVLFFTATNAGTSFFKSMGWTTNTLDQFNQAALVLENLWITTYTNTAVTAVDAQSFITSQIKNSAITRNYCGSSISTIPPTDRFNPLTANSIAWNLPQLDCAGYNGGDHVAIEGYGYAMWLGEHGTFDNIFISTCGVGIGPKAGNFPNTFNTLYTGDCKTNISSMSASSILYIYNWESERNASGEWRQNDWEFIDAGSIHGFARWIKKDDISSTNDRRPWVSGNTNFRLTDGFNSRIYGAGAAAIIDRGISTVNVTGDAVPGSMSIIKVRGTSVSPAAVQSGDFLGLYSFAGYDGTTYPGVVNGYISGEVIGAVSAGVVPTAINIYAGNTTSPNKIMQLDNVSGISTPYAHNISVAVGGSFTLTATNQVYILNADAQTATLPTAVSARGRDYIIKLRSPGTTGTVATTSSQLIDGASTYSLASSNAFVRVVSDGTNWWSISN